HCQPRRPSHDDPTQTTNETGQQLQAQQHPPKGKCCNDPLNSRNGGFEAPQLLWSTAEKGESEFWVDLNTHTHANWTFTEPGTHQVGLRIKGKTTNGEEFSTDGVLTFAVGDGANVQAAQDAEWNPGDATTEGSSLPLWIYVLVGGGIIVLIAGVAVLVKSRKRGDGHG
ncbi:choice-of-anchor M domain-containing protein, partial [Corynebacterium macginleyi]|uniref:choice-of-anchor M domain-containing protein n=1 Tax=Corynebacterium macginleyi TaxID=38290 RepID=UPI001F172B02